MRIRSKTFVKKPRLLAGGTGVPHTVCPAAACGLMYLAKQANIATDAGLQPA
jgi:hypothetical protein